MEYSPLKLVYTPTLFEPLIQVWEKIDLEFKGEKFLADVFSSEWDELELMGRVHHIATCINSHLNKPYEQALPIFLNLYKEFEKVEPKIGGFEYLFFPRFIELYGTSHPDISLKAIEIITQRISCEFAIRPYILLYEEKCMKQMISWSNHKNENIRRLSSEGCRPRLPWAKALPKFKDDPTPVLPILENLKSDSSLFVRKSVANHLNDISKDHPQLFLRLAKKWISNGAESQWIIKHASRTLLKAGDPEAIELFGYSKLKNLKFNFLSIENKSLRIGESLQFSFAFENSGTENLLLRIEYAIYFLRNNQQLNKKVFKHSEKEISPGSKMQLNKSHSFKPITTRKYYAGKQKLSIIINGKEQAFEAFNLLLETTHKPNG